MATRRDSPQKSQKGKKYIRKKEYRRQNSEDRINLSAFILTSEFCLLYFFFLNVR
jgi:hypothetical protein